MFLKFILVSFVVTGALYAQNIKPLFKIEWGESLYSVSEKLCSIKGAENLEYKAKKILGKGFVNATLNCKDISKNNIMNLVIPEKAEVCMNKKCTEKKLVNVTVQELEKLGFILNIKNKYYIYMKDHLLKPQITINLNNINIAGTPTDINVVTEINNDFSAFAYLNNVSPESFKFQNKNLYFNSFVRSMKILPKNNH